MQDIICVKCKTIYKFVETTVISQQMFGGHYHGHLMRCECGNEIVTGLSQLKCGCTTKALLSVK